MAVDWTEPDLKYNKHDLRLLRPQNTPAHETVIKTCLIIYLMTALSDRSRQQKFLSPHLTFLFLKCIYYIRVKASMPLNSCRKNEMIANLKAKIMDKIVLSCMVHVVITVNFWLARS